MLKRVVAGHKVEVPGQLCKFFANSVNIKWSFSINAEINLRKVDYIS